MKTIPIIKSSRRYMLVGKKPVRVNDFVKWAMWYENANRVVRQTQLSEDIRVSTVFIGLDHQWGEGPLMVFETMIFGGEHDEYCERYSTWEEAEKGHEEAIKMVYGVQ